MPMWAPWSPDTVNLGTQDCQVGKPGSSTCHSASLVVSQSQSIKPKESEFPFLKWERAPLPAERSWWGEGSDYSAKATSLQSPIPYGLLGLLCSAHCASAGMKELQKTRDCVAGARAISKLSTKSGKDGWEPYMTYPS